MRGATGLTSIVKDTSLCPVFDDHGQRTDATIELDVGVDHARILYCGQVVHVDVAGEMQLRIPDFYYPNLSCRYTHDSLHAIYSGQ